MNVMKYLWALFFTLLALPVFAQQNGVEVKGIVIEEENKKPIEQATVRLLHVKDSTLVGGVPSGKNGSFSLKNIQPGTYLLNISFVGYEPLYQALQVTGKNNPVNLGKLSLNDGIVLEEAIVIGKAAEVVVRNDTIEYNADSFRVTEGAVLEDLLRKMPGIEVDSEGKVTVNGKEIKKIMVDGKEFFSSDPKVAVKNLPAKMIDKVQSLDKKSDMAKLTGFDDGEEEAVLNLTVKPGMKQGWFGNVYGGYGSEDRYEANAMVNRFYDNDQFTLMGGINNTNNMGMSDLSSSMFSGMGGSRRSGGVSVGAGSGITTSGNAGVNFSKELQTEMTLGGNIRYFHSDNDAYSKSRKENYLEGDSMLIDNQEAWSNAISNNLGANFRFEWKPDTLTNIIFRPDISYSRSSIWSESDKLTTDQWSDTLYTTHTRDNSNGEGYNLNMALDYSRKLNNKGRVISFSLSGGYSDSYNEGMSYSETQYFREIAEQEDILLDQQYRYDNKGYNYRAYISWVEPLGRNNFLQATYSFRQNNQESLKNTYLRDETSDLYNILDSTYSQSYRNNFITQRASLSFKSQREKFNYTLGINVDPSYNKSETFVHDTVLSTLSRSVVNVSPMAQFNYMFDKRTNFRINYNGRISQPSINQLQPIESPIDATSYTTGNPDLKPTYTNDVYIQFQKFIPEKQRAFMVMSNGNYVHNDIVSKTNYLEDGRRENTYENVNGNFRGNLRVMINSPFINSKFSYNTMTYLSYVNSNGFVNAEKNTNKTISVNENLGVNFRSDLLDLGINGSIRYTRQDNSLQTQGEQNIFNYTAGGDMILYLPLNFKVESDITYATNSGYSDGFKQREILWNASASKIFLKNNQGTIRFKYYDILQQRSNISRIITANYTQDSEYNTLGSYFMVHFIYRFNIFKGGRSASDLRRPESGDRPSRGERPPGAGGGRPPRM